MTEQKKQKTSDWVSQHRHIPVNQCVNSQSFLATHDTITTSRCIFCDRRQLSLMKDWHSDTTGNGMLSLSALHFSVSSISSIIFQAVKNIAYTDNCGWRNLPGIFVGCLVFYVLETYNGISGRVPTSDSAHSWQFYSAALIGAWTDSPLSHIILTLSQSVLALS